MDVVLDFITAEFKSNKTEANTQARGTGFPLCRLPSVRGSGSGHWQWQWQISAAPAPAPGPAAACTQPGRHLTSYPPKQAHLLVPTGDAPTHFPSFTLSRPPGPTPTSYFCQSRYC